MNVAEDVVFRTGPGNGEVQVLVARVVVQVAIRRAMGYKEVDAVWQGNRPFEVRAGRDAIELDSVILDAAVFQKDDTARDEVAGPDRVGVEDAVMVTGNEDSEFCRDGAVPFKEVLQVGRIEPLAGIPGADEDVGVCGYCEPPVHPVGVRKSKYLVGFEVYSHLITGSGQYSFRPQFLHLKPAQTESNWLMAASTRSGSSVRMPASKLRVRVLFIPSPAPVRLAEPM